MAPNVEEVLAGLPRWNQRYEFLDVLAMGGFGIAVRARQRSLARTVVVKLLHQQDEESRRRFRVEAEILAAIRHPNVVEVLEYDQEGEWAYLVMPHVEGESMAQVLERGPLPWRAVAATGRQVAKGLEGLHSRKVLHRDVKPGNILLGQDGRTLLCDLGLGLRQGDPRLTGPGMLVGTMTHAPPELLLDGRTDARSDLYSLGIVLYEALTGDNPFAAGNLEETCSRQLRTRIEAFPPGIEAPRELQSLVIRLLRKEPENRPASAAEVALTLAEIEAERPERAVTPVTKQPRRLGILLGSIVVTSITLVTIWRPDSSPSTAEPAPVPPGSHEKAKETLRRILDGDDRARLEETVFLDRKERIEPLGAFAGAIETARTSIPPEELDAMSGPDAVAYLVAGLVPMIHARSRSWLLYNQDQTARVERSSTLQDEELGELLRGVLLRQRILRTEFYRKPPHLEEYSRQLLGQLEARATRPGEGWIVERLFRVWASLLFILHVVDFRFLRAGDPLARSLDATLEGSPDPRHRLAILMFRTLRSGVGKTDHGLEAASLDRLGGPGAAGSSIWALALRTVEGADPDESHEGIHPITRLPILEPVPFLRAGREGP